MHRQVRITIPAPVRVALGLDMGSRVAFVEIEKSKYAIIPATSPVLALKGMLKKPDKPVSIDSMSQEIALHGALAR